MSVKVLVSVRVLMSVRLWGYLDIVGLKSGVIYYKETYFVTNTSC